MQLAATQRPHPPPVPPRPSRQVVAEALKRSPRPPCPTRQAPPPPNTKPWRSDQQQHQQQQNLSQQQQQQQHHQQQQQTCPIGGRTIVYESTKEIVCFERNDNAAQQLADKAQQDRGQARGSGERNDDNDDHRGNARERRQQCCPAVQQNNDQLRDYSSGRLIVDDVPRTLPPPLPAPPPPPPPPTVSSSSPPPPPLPLQRHVEDPRSPAIVSSSRVAKDREIPTYPGRFPADDVRFDNANSSASCDDDDVDLRRRDGLRNDVGVIVVSRSNSNNSRNDARDRLDPTSIKPDQASSRSNVSFCASEPSKIAGRPRIRPERSANVEKPMAICRVDGRPVIARRSTPTSVNRGPSEDSTTRNNVVNESTRTTSSVVEKPIIRTTPNDDRTVTTTLLLDEPERKAALDNEDDYVEDEEDDDNNDNNIHRQDWLEAGVRYSSTQITLPGDDGESVDVDRVNGIDHRDEERIADLDFVR